jgi:hypothetical protein
LTENLVPPAPEDRFDKWDPSNVAPFVAYLASSACSINGQVFLVGGGLVQRVAPWSLDPDWKLSSDVRWSIESLTAAVGKAGPPENVGRLTGNIK